MAEIIVVGGGAAGMMAAIAAAQRRNHVRLFEKNEKLGKKIFITGKGRCNVTNACDRENFFENIVTNPKFMFSAFGKWNNWDMYNYLEEVGLPLKIERGNRVFPQSDKSSDVIRTLQHAMDREGVDWQLNSPVKGLILESLIPEGVDSANVSASDASESAVEAGTATEATGKGKSKKKVKKNKNQQTSVCRGIILADGTKVYGDQVILATGGVSYPTTGSTGDGHHWAKKAGHQVTELLPALVPFDAVFHDGSPCKELQGLALKNIAVQVCKEDKVLATDFGEMLFTHFGVSGPVILTASNRVTAEAKKAPLDLYIDLKPALTEEQLDARLLRELENGANKQMKNLMGTLFPARMIPVMLRYTGISGDKKGREITREERQTLLRTMKHFHIRLLATRSFREAIITQGGVSCKEVQPSSMESKIVKNLYFAGEILDVDAFTGGYNLQVAWSTGYLAGIQHDANKED